MTQASFDNVRMRELLRAWLDWYEKEHQDTPPWFVTSTIEILDS